MASKPRKRVRKQPSQEAVAARAVFIRSLNDAKTQVIDLARRNGSQSDDIDQSVGRRSGARVELSHVARG